MYECARVRKCVGMCVCGVGWGGVIAATWIALDSKWRGREGEKWAVIVHEAKEIGRD